MFTVIKRMEIAGSHCLDLPYESKCKNNHGHNWIVTVHLRAKKLDPRFGMIMDFTEIKRSVHDLLDHQNLNDIIEQPTAERIAEHICLSLLPGCCFKVEVQESEGNVAIYERDTENEIV